MTAPDSLPDAKLPRLNREFYQGKSMVHWTMTMRDRATGWLEAEFHERFRFCLLHTLSRYRLVCPVYTLMPDHFHMLWLGLCRASDQRLAAAFLRKHLNDILPPLRLQKQPYDHVLREKERERGAFQGIAAYILENPVRKKLAKSADGWPFSGCLVAGYPVLDVHAPQYWELFWRIYSRLIDA